MAGLACDDEIGLRPMTGLPGKRIIIVGGGASGALMACHLLRDRQDDCVVTLIERRETIGPGLAFSTDRPEHLLNVRAANMSAFSDDPLHFWRWLVEQGAEQSGLCPDPYCFVPRPVYGRYIAGLVGNTAVGLARPDRLQIVQGECRVVDEKPNGIAVTLADGTIHLGQVVVLATGNDAYDWGQAGRYRSPWREGPNNSESSPLPVLILGTGLSMVDYVLSLRQQGYAKPIYALSRRGLLPQEHRDMPALQISKEDVPFGAGARALLRWFRATLTQHQSEGGDWRSVVDGIRPYTQEIWWKLSMSSKRRLLEHARSYWDVHRHSMAPQIGSRLQELLAGGQLRILAGKVSAVDEHERGADVTYRLRGRSTSEILAVEGIVDCRGIVADPKTSANPVIASLLDQGLARPDALHIGLDVSANCAVLDAKGVASRRLFAIGPLTRASFWETIAIPDIRNQCAMLARHIKGKALAGEI